MDGLSVFLPAGTYWLAVVPISSGGGGSYLSMTYGANAIGSPAGNDSGSFIVVNGLPPQSTAFTLGLQGVSPPYDFSMGVLIDDGTPEPASALLIASGGLLGIALRPRRLQLWR